MKILKNFKFPISIKLVVLTVLLLMAATIPIAFKSSDLFETVSGQREEDSNRAQAKARATEVEGLLVNFTDKMKVIGSLLLKRKSSKDANEALDVSFFQDRDLVSVEVIKITSGNSPELHERIVNEEYLKQYKKDKDYIDQLRKAKPFALKAVMGGQIEIQNSSLPDGAPLMTVGLPFVKDDFGRITHIVLADIRLDRLQKTFSEVSERVIYLIDRKGQLLAHPNDRWAIQGYSMNEVPIVKKTQNLKIREGQMRFTDPESNTTFIGSYAKTAFGVTVIAQVEENIILEPAREVRRRAFYITGIVLSIALFLIFVFSITLTNPIEHLLETTIEVAKGNFDVKANINSRDEVGELAQAFDQMTDGLKERDKVKSMFNKFHGSSVTEDLLEGSLELGGSRKDVTVFFSDIRDFTKFSEGHTPEEVVEMLNEYFHIMVGIINKYNGVVDKFIGDAIMAVWGAPKTTGEDSYLAVKACIEMRVELEKLNKKRIERGQVPIKIGMGLHSGAAISGTIGSDERMEYTVIGDTVNMASRIEASTKAFGTDLLLSDDIVKEVEDKFILELGGSAEVKGKSEPLKMFKVRGYIDENGQEVMVKTPYSDYEAGNVDKVKVA